MEKKKKRKIWPWLVLVALLLAGLAVFWSLRNRAAANSTAGYTSHTVQEGSVVSSVTGSGTLSAPDTKELKLPDGILVDEVTVKTGDRVGAGETLAVLNEGSLLEKAAALSEELAAQNRKVTGTQKKVAAIYAAVTGRVKYLPVQKGDDVAASVAQYGALAILSTDGLMQAKIVSHPDIAPATEVVVKWDGGSAEGEVARRTADGLIVTFSDRKAPYLSSVEVYLGGEPLGSGIAEIHAPLAVYAIGGAIEKVHCKVGDYVTAMTKLFTLYNSPSEAYEQAVAARDDTQALLETVLIYCVSPNVTAPADGVISSIACAEGSKTGGAASLDGESAAFTLDVGGAVVMTIQVDELDIGSLTIGQSASVRLDALGSDLFAGTLTRISALGDAAGSITNYDVELRLAADARFRAGMHGNATITIGQVVNVPVIPLGYIFEDANGSYVYLGDERTPAYIGIGASDGAIAEVKSGLAVGDVIWRASSESMFPFMMGGEERMQARNSNGLGG